MDPARLKTSKGALFPMGYGLWCKQTLHDFLLISDLHILYNEIILISLYYSFHDFSFSLDDCVFHKLKLASTLCDANPISKESTVTKRKKGRSLTN